MEFPFSLTEEQILSLIVVGTLAVVAIVGVNALAPKAGVAAPLVLVAVGVVVSFVPAVPEIEFEPEWILAGILPPLLYSAAVGLPTMDFRRDFTAISGLSVVLVLLSTALLGYLFTWLIPGIPLAAGFALGAIVSPTDAVATSIVKRLGASPRVVTLLEGESLLNDASALVLLRSAIAGIGIAVATGGSATRVSLWSVAGDFVFAVVVAVLVGFLVGFLGLFVRRRLANPALSTAVSFVGRSSRTCRRRSSARRGSSPSSPRDSSPATAPRSTCAPSTGSPRSRTGGPSSSCSRAPSSSSWGSSCSRSSPTCRRPTAACGARSAWRRSRPSSSSSCAPRTSRRSCGRSRDARGGASRCAASSRACRRSWTRASRPTGRPSCRPRPPRPGPPRPARRLGPRGDAAPRWSPRRPRSGWGLLRSSLRRRAADIDYLTAERLGWREGTLLVWAGMRGVVTLAAAQTLPLDTPQRSFLVLVAFGVAAGTLVVQGGTLPWVVRRLGLSGGSTRADEDRGAVRAELDGAAVAVIDVPDLRRADGTTYDGDVVARVRRDVVRELENRDTDAATSADLFAQYKELRLRAIAAQRVALLDARTSGAYSSQALRHALDLLDAEQIDLELRRGPYVPGDDD